jgi:hypothetical protein
MNRHVLSIVVVILCGGCRHVENTPVPVVNLIREIDSAEKRPIGGFEVATREIDGHSHPSIVMPVPSRLTIRLPLPRHGVLRAVASIDPHSAAVPIRLRVGVSDNRIYEQLTDVILSPGERQWTVMHTDLSAYAGWKWSLFYHPERMIWGVVVAADAIGGAPTRAIWGSPEIITDTESAKEYSARRQRFR